MRRQITAQSQAAVIHPAFVRTKQEQARSGTSATVLSFATPEIGVPNYLLTHYWWAYVHPKAVKLFERQWLVNLILWGNYERLRDATLAEMEELFGGRSLQVACVYGDLTSRLSRRIASRGGMIDVVDVLPVQLRNLREKLPKGSPARLLAMDATNLRLPDASYDQALIFFLLHEQPDHYRERTMSELFRVVKPGARSSLLIMLGRAGGIHCVMSGGRCSPSLNLLLSICGGMKLPNGFRVAGRLACAG